MIKKITFGIITLLLVSCGVEHTDFSGNWIDKKNESDKMIIKKNGANYIVENREKKYPANIRDGLLEISAEFPVKAIIDENDILIVGGKEYIRFEKSKIYAYIGTWKPAYFVNNGTNRMSFHKKTGITKGHIIIESDLTVQCVDFENTDGMKLDCKIMEKLFGQLNNLNVADGVLQTKTINEKGIIEYSIDNDNLLKIKETTDSDYWLFEKI